VRSGTGALALLCLLFAVSRLSVIAGDRPTGRSFATRSEVIARNGMAATSQPLATMTAVEILRRGGSAVDAAIAANAVLGVAEPTGCGIGGDLFAIVWDAKSGQLHGLNGSGRSPRSLPAEEFRTPPDAPSNFRVMRGYNRAYLEWTSGGGDTAGFTVPKKQSTALTWSPDTGARMLQETISAVAFR